MTDIQNDKDISRTINKIIGFHLPTEPNGCFSNWFPAEFDLAGHHYVNSEQYMMVRKVLLAKKYDLADKIMSTSDPSEAKEYAGPKFFPEFNKIEEIWKQISKHIVKFGVREKFLQNPELLKELLETGDALLAECARQDLFWGIGINLNDDSWQDVSNWRGNNCLGIILMELREEFRQEMNICGTLQFIDYRNAEPVDVWKMKAGQLKRIPQYYNAIHTYALQLPAGSVRNCFYYDYTLNDWDIAMGTNMGGGLPIIGFYEMKQEVYEVFRRLSGKHYVSEIFAEEPEYWGSRGDPYFWKHLASRFAWTEFPIKENEFIEKVHKEFWRMTETELKEDVVCLVEDFMHGGMSSGQLSGKYWINKAIPMLLKRLNQRQS